MNERAAKNGHPEAEPVLELGPIRVRSDLQGGDLGRLISLHGSLYEPREEYGLSFEAYVAKTVAEYVLDNQARGRIWLAERGQDLVGCAAIAERDGGRAQLRWVLVRPDQRGLGLGRALVELALDYAVGRDFREIYLETTDGLEASMRLYHRLGFVITEQLTAPLWHGERLLIRMVRKLSE